MHETVIPRGVLARDTRQGDCCPHGNNIGLEPPASDAGVAARYVQRRHARGAERGQELGGRYPVRGGLCNAPGGLTKACDRGHELL
jgi:hypothetical protein